jgi:hypothetical protein
LKKAAQGEVNAPDETAPQCTEPLCDACRRKKSADVFAEAFGERMG